MRDDPIHPIRPIHAIEPLRDVAIPSHPSLGQLRTWLRFARQMASRRKASDAQQAQAMTSAPEEHSGEQPHQSQRGPGKWA